MKPPVLEYERARSVEHALTLLAELGDEAKLLAGGQSLVPMLNLRLARPSVLIDISRLGVNHVEASDGQVRLGALLRHRDLEYDARIAELVPLLARCAKHIGHPAIRNRGTLGGSISHADATAELCLAALTLDASLVLSSRDRGNRQVRAADFFLGPFMTTIEPDEMLTEVVLPAPNGARRRVHFEEVTERAGDFATAAIAGAYTEDRDRFSDVRVAVVGIAPTPVRLPAVEAAVNGQTVGQVDLQVVDDAIRTDAGDLGVDQVEKQYELALARGLVRDFLQ
jgi:CO/xanthine dehydrogenase FAD-binding subunit